MTVAYSIKLFKMIDDLVKRGLIIQKWETIPKSKSYFYIIPKEQTINNEELYFSNTEMLELGRLLHNAVYFAYPSLQEEIAYLNGLVKAATVLNQEFYWITPAYLKIGLGYRIFKTKPSLSLYKKGKGPSYATPTDELNKLKNRQAFMPNLIHSLDATNIVLLIKNLESVTKINNIETGKRKNEPLNLLTIHDSFASTPDQLGLIVDMIKASFIEIYFEKDYLDILHRSFLEQIGKYTPVETILIKDNDGNEYEESSFT